MYSKTFCIRHVLSDKNLLSAMSRERRENSSAVTDAVAFLVAFCQADLRTYREGDLLNLWDDFRKFGEVVIGDNFPFYFLIPGRPPSLDRYLSLQSELLNLLSFITEPVPRSPGDSWEFAAGLAKEDLPVRLGVLQREGSRPMIVIQPGADPFALIRLKAATILFGDGGNAVRRCRREGCANFFVRVRKQQYCSRRCANAASMKAWLAARQENRAAHRESSHKTYEKRIRKQVGAKVTVPRRPRKQS